MSKKVVIEFDLSEIGGLVDTGTFVITIDGKPVPFVQSLELSANVHKKYGSLKVEQAGVF